MCGLYWCEYWACLKHVDRYRAGRPVSGQERLAGPGLGGGVVMVEAGLEAAGGELPAAAAVPASSTSGQPYTYQGILIQYTHTVTFIHSCTHTLMQSHSSWILIHSAQACHTHTLRQSHSYTGLMQ